MIDDLDFIGYGANRRSAVARRRVPGESDIATKNGVERLSKRSLEFVVKS